MIRIGFGGSCHWCTEAIFQSIRGVSEVQQGWIASVEEAAEFSEAVLVDFDPEMIPEATLVAVHLHTHSCTSTHSMREKYRSAVYTFSDRQAEVVANSIKELQVEFAQKIITQVLPFDKFKLNKAEDLNYYYNNPEKPFCTTYINPKLKVLMERFKAEVNQDLQVNQSS